MSFKFAPKGEAAVPLHVVSSEGLTDWLDAQDGIVKDWVAANGFSGALGSTLLVPDATGKPAMALAGYGTAQKRARQRFPLAAAVSGLGSNTYSIESGLTADTADVEVLGWLLSGYKFTKYHGTPAHIAQVSAPDPHSASKLEILAQGEALTRDLINTPASDMGPDALEAAARDLAGGFGADISVITGDDLLEQNFPMIHTVGRAADRAPRLIDMSWGTSGPRLTLVGKGVCFDTGGLNIKPGASMGLMKKDMGGAANVLGLAYMIMALELPLRLRVLIPAVENAISGNAFRPQDILTSRKGLTVEINNTDAEGRLVLADALALADEDNPDLLISMATLTGAARVAVGPDLAPFYTDDDKVATSLSDAAAKWADPVWRMPFWEPYETMIEPGIADLDNAPKGGMAGSITAALFLRRFVENAKSFAHFDIYGWQPSAAPGRSQGGFGQGPRAILGALPDILDL